MADSRGSRLLPFALGAVAAFLALVRPSPAVAVGPGGDPTLAAMEAAAGRGDERALLALADRWAALGAPGLAASALSRLPPATRHLPERALVEARVLAANGLPGPALDRAREAASACSRGGCTAELAATAGRRAGWLVALAEQGALEAPAEVMEARVHAR